MSDSSGRATRARRGRGSSRTSSARSSALVDESPHPHPLPLPPHTLRPTESRFSLNEQFAVTRREFEFGFDDSSSVYERITLPPDAAEDADQDRTLTAGLEGLEPPWPATGSGGPHASGGISRDYYELLCIPRDASLSPDAIRSAYYRLFQLLRPDKQSPVLRRAAEAYFKQVQVAFETLIEPYRRVNYDVSCGEESASDSAVLDAEDVAELDKDADYDGVLQERYLQMCQDRVGTTGDLAIRIDATSLLQQYPRYPRPRSWRALTPLDISVRQSTTVEIPALSTVMESSIHAVQDALSSDSQSSGKGSRLRCAPLMITLSGSVQGFMKETSLMSAPPVLDHLHPAGPAIHGRRRLMRIVDNRFFPLVVLKLRQELYWQGPRAEATDVRSKNATLPDIVVEVETDMSPEPVFAARVAHSISVPEAEPVHVELSVQTLNSWRGNTPTLGMALHRRLSTGTVFMAIDGGDWTLRPDETCNRFSEFSKINKGFGSRSTLPQPPTVEVGYTFSSYEMGLRAGRAFTRQAERGVRGMDCDVEDDHGGSWTISAGGTSSNLAAYLRYGQDLFSSLIESQSATLPPGNRSHRFGGIRTEVELSTSQRMDYFLALRSLKRVGRFSKIGFEVGLTPYNLHLSVYWSRLGQRISLPFLVANKATLNTGVAFWSALIPFISFAALEILVWQPRSKAKRRSVRELTKDQLLEYIARRRNEADELTTVLAGPVEQRQRVERQSGGLVVLSAKYGIKDAGSASGWANLEEVADVTIAVAALVDGGRLLIPGGLRKSHILGFWDPAPTRTKVLRVTYLNAGKEQTVEVSGRDESRLP